jgi:iron(III) transport system substrate-binding protein
MMKNVITAVVMTGLLVACNADAPEDGAQSSSSLTIYSGRNEALIGPMLERFEEISGIAVEVRYAETAELAATLMEEGEYTPADVFISQDAAALGALSDLEMLRPLPEELLGKVAPEHRSLAGTWVGLSGRARSVVFNTGMVSEEDLPQSLEEIANPRYRGRFGVAPANGSFQAHMAAYSVQHGEEALATLLDGMAANEPKRYPKNSAIVEAVVAGEVEFGLVNHYYLHRAQVEAPDVQARNFYMPEGVGSRFVNLAGIGALSDNPAAVELIEFLLGTEAQLYYAEQTFEYPLVGFDAAGEAANGLMGEQVDFGSISTVLEATLVAIQDSGLLE